MKHWISALFALGFLLAGFGCSDATNRSGGDFLASQGFSIESRDTLSALLPVTSVEVVPVEGIPAPPGTGGLWTGGFGSDSIRAVVAFALHGASGADASLNAILGAGDLRTRYPLSRLHFGLDTAGVADTTLTPRLHVRFLLLDSTSAIHRGAIMGLLMGREPADLGLSTVRDFDSTFSMGAKGGIPLGASLRGQVAGRLSDTTRHAWLVALIDGHPGQQVLQIAAPTLRTDSTEGSYSPATLQERVTWRSSHLRSASSPAVSVGWWVDGGRRLRLRVDGDALRKVLHDRLGAGSVSDSFDNSFNILSARVRTPFRDFSRAATSVDDRAVGLAGAVVLEEMSGHAHRATISGGAATLPVDLGTARRIEFGLSVDPKIVCDDTTYPGSGLLRCQYYQEGGVGVLPTRLSLGYGSSSLFTASEFLLRTDIPDSLEFRVAGTVRVRMATSGADVRLNWSLLRSAPNADVQTNSDSVRPEARLRSSGGAVVRQEIRTSLSQAVVQRKFQLDLDVVPGGGSTTMHDLWEAVPRLPSVADSLRLVVRPRGGAF